MRAVFQQCLDLRTHMIFMKRRGGLFENSLENGREVGHCHDDTVTIFSLRPTAKVKKLRYFFETTLVAAAAWLLPRLPRALVLALARAVGWLACQVDARGRRTARENLRAAYRGALTEREVRRITLGSYQNFARTFLDLFWARALTQENWQRHVSIRMDDPGAEAQARATGAVWVTPHFGNFEFVSLIWGFRGVPFTVVAQDFKNPGLTGIFRRLREHSGHTVISQEHAMLKLMKALKRQGHAGLLTDLNIKPGKAATIIDCFGLKTCVPTLHVELAKRLGLSIITGVCQPAADGRYEVQIFEAIRPRADDDTQAVAQRIWDQFEKAIRAYPEGWLWMYKHWRYRPAGTEPGQYPAYANPYPAFQTLLESLTARPAQA
jgi:lauroyl/myristoyl acyltransferase